MRAGDEIKSRILLRRFGQPEEVAHAVWFLASRFADYITGQVLSRRWRFQNGMTATMAQNTISRKEEISPSIPRWRRRSPTRSAATSSEVKPDASLIDDLGAESIDFLDLVFRLERAFKMKIPRGKIIEDARGDLPESRVRAEGAL